MDNRQISQIKSVLGSLTSEMPGHLRGSERQNYINAEVVDKLDRNTFDWLRCFMDACLMTMREMEASDIEFGGLGSGGMIWLRKQGLKKPVADLGSWTLDEFGILILCLLTPVQRAALFEQRNLDFAYEVERESHILRHRADAYFDLNSLALNMRSVQGVLRPWVSYGFNPQVTRLLSLAHTREGLILVTGITGSGKSTTLDAIVNLNNETVESHIVIIASPVEYIHQSKKCIIRHREVGRDTRTFRSGVIESLRQDPDIIVIGEMRDSETIIAALEAADSGHKVFSTLHTSSALESIDRLIAETPPIEQDRIRSRLADVLRCVISQKLVPSADGKMILAKEILILTPAIRAAIKNNNTNEIYQMMTEGSQQGMTTMENDLRMLLLNRKITRETALDFANNKRLMQQMLQGVG